MTLSPSAARVLLAGVLLSAGAMALAACESAGSVSAEDLVGASDDQTGDELNGSVVVGATATTTADVNFRSAASTSGKVYRVIAKGTAVTFVKATPTNSFYQVKHNGTTGWISGKYLTPEDSGNDGDSGGNSSPATGSPGASTRDKAITRAKSAMGFSYWWGHGRWRPEGPTSSTRGSCSGSCGKCSHSGSYGSDCSGLIAKVWQVPSNNDDVTVDMHPYGTADFDGNTSQWSIISRSNLQKADALVYRSGSSGHIILFGSGDGWGSMNAYECKGCSSGCVYNLRTASSSYKGIRRKGW